MPNFDPQPFHLYRVHTQADVNAAFVRLLKAQKTLEARGIAAVPKIYERVARLARTLAIEASGNLRLHIAHESIRWIDPTLIDAFIALPENQDWRDAISMELAFAGTLAGDNPKPSFTPYTPEEFGTILLGSTFYFDDIVFLRTLRWILDGVGNDEYSVLVATAFPALAEEFVDVEKEYEWDDAFVFGAMLQTVWKAFPFLGDEIQRRMLENYFYLAIVAGVPVRQYLAEMFQVNAPGFDRGAFAKHVTEAMNNNRETVPTTTGVEEGRPFADILKEFLAKVYTDNIGTLAEVQFVDGFYQSQPHRDMFAGWLREALSIVLHARKGDL